MAAVCPSSRPRHSQAWWKFCGHLVAVEPCLAPNPCRSLWPRFATADQKRSWGRCRKDRWSFVRVPLGDGLFFLESETFSSPGTRLSGADRRGRCGDFIPQQPRQRAAARVGRHEPVPLPGFIGQHSESARFLKIDTLHMLDPPIPFKFVDL